MTDMIFSLAVLGVALGGVVYIALPDLGRRIVLWSIGALLVSLVLGGALDQRAAESAWTGGLVMLVLALPVLVVLGRGVLAGLRVGHRRRLAAAKRQEVARRSHRRPAALPPRVVTSRQGPAREPRQSVDDGGFLS